MMKRPGKYPQMITMSTILAGVICSCQMEDEVYPAPPLPQVTQTKLGKQLENPYTVENMKTAQQNIAPANGRLSQTIEVITTHFYVKFTPRTDEELDILNKDSTLILYDYPLDYDIEVNGNYYRDPAVPEGQPTP